MTPALSGAAAPICKTKVSPVPSHLQSQSFELLIRKKLRVRKEKRWGDRGDPQMSIMDNSHLEVCLVHSEDSQGTREEGAVGL